LYAITPQKLLKSLDLVVYIENGWSLSGKYSIQTMIFRFLCALVWFKNIEKMLLQVTSGFLQFESTIGKLSRSTEWMSVHRSVILRGKQVTHEE
jgi:hypothetical protein